MAVNHNQISAESQYIDNLLDVDHNEVEYIGDTNLQPLIEDVLSANGINTYQLILISDVKFAISSHDILHFVELADVEIDYELVKYENMTYVIANIAHLIGGEITQSENNRYLLIKDRQIAIPYKDTLNIIDIDRDLICWRTCNSKREWLAGTIKSDGIAIIDLLMLQKLKFGD